MDAPVGPLLHQVAIMLYPRRVCAKDEGRNKGPQPGDFASEVVELIFSETTLEKGAGVDAGEAFVHQSKSKMHERRFSPYPRTGTECISHQSWLRSERRQHADDPRGGHAFDSRFGSTTLRELLPSSIEVPSSTRIRRTYYLQRTQSGLWTLRKDDIGGGINPAGWGRKSRRS
jgi:hypothetical protein